MSFAHVAYSSSHASLSVASAGSIVWKSVGWLTTSVSGGGALRPLPAVSTKPRTVSARTASVVSAPTSRKTRMVSRRCRLRLKASRD
jgi:hypothetical protein